MEEREKNLRKKRDERRKRKREKKRKGERVFLEGNNIMEEVTYVQKKPNFLRVI